MTTFKIHIHLANSWQYLFSQSCCCRILTKLMVWVRSQPRPHLAVMFAPHPLLVLRVQLRLLLMWLVLHVRLAPLRAQPKPRLQQRWPQHARLAKLRLPWRAQPLPRLPPLNALFVRHLQQLRARYVPLQQNLHLAQLFPLRPHAQLLPSALCVQQRR